MEGAEALTQKIGPLPGYAYVIGIAGIAWVVYLRNKSAKAAASQYTAPAGTETVFPSAYGNAPGTNGPVAASPAGPMSTSTTNNASWAKMVSDALIASGSNPSDVSNALDKWLNGQTLSSTEQAIINTVQRQYGTPPNGVLPVKIQHASADSGHSYTVQAGDTLDSISQKFYGNASNPLGMSVIEKTNAAANGLNWNGQTHSFDVAPGQTIELYQDGLYGMQDNSLHWP